MTMTRAAAPRISVLAATALLVSSLCAQSAYPPPNYPASSYPPQNLPPQNYPAQDTAQNYPPPGYPQQAPAQGYPNQQQYPQQPEYGARGLQGAEENADDPTRGVARIAILQGEANVRRGDSGELVAAAINAPLVTQDHLITAAGSRAEVQLDAANVFRLAGGTEVVLGDVEYHKFQVQLAQGTLMYSVVRDLKAEAEIDTPSIAIRPRRVGAYRITILPDGTTQVTVRSGAVEVLSPNGSEFLEAGHTMLIRGSRQSPEFITAPAIAVDEFDRWCGGRDQQMQRSVSAHNVASDIYGADDLDQYGRWVPSQYGQSWVPNNQAPDWAPYSTGQWTWEDYYGWTWVDSAPWGWAPYHYGRWFQNGGYGWAWYPGPIYSPYYWRPALVGFFGFGGFSIGFGFGNIGWCPLAPFEMFHPWYGRGFYGGYGHSNFTIVHNTNITNVYRNARYTNAVTSTSASGFGNGRQAFSRPSGSQLTQAGLMRGGLPVAPTQRSLQFSQRGAAPGANSFSRGSQQFYSRFQGSNTTRVPFSTQARQMQQFSRNSYSGSSASAQSGFKPSSPQRNASGGATGNSGWPAFGQSFAGPAAQSGASRPGSGLAESASGWHSFGAPHQTTTPQPYGYRSAPGPGANGYAAPQSIYRGGSSYRAPSMGQPRGGSSYSAPTYSSPPARGYSAPQSRYSGPTGSGGSGQRSSPPSSSGGGAHSGGGGHASHSGGGHHH
jgi:FecR protein